MVGIVTSRPTNPDSSSGFGALFHIAEVNENVCEGFSIRRCLDTISFSPQLTCALCFNFQWYAEDEAVLIVVMAAIYWKYSKQTPGVHSLVGLIYPHTENN